jgi:hypothetical protein
MAMETMTEALARLDAAGFGDDLVVAGSELRRAAAGEALDPSTLRAVEIVRFEGASDPDDEAVVVAVATRAGVPVGTLTLPYGPGASTDEAAVLKHLHRTLVDATEVAVAHDAHDHIAAVFGDRRSAEAAVADLREIGLCSEHLGVAVHGREHTVFEYDDEADLEHSLETSIGAGAVLGFLGGMLLFAVAVPGIGTLGAGGIAALGGGCVLGGALVGGTAGLAATAGEWDSHQRLRETHLEPHEVLVVACAHHHPRQLRDAFLRHGGRLVEVT